MALLCEVSEEGSEQRAFRRASCSAARAVRLQRKVSAKGRGQSRMPETGDIYGEDSETRAGRRAGSAAARAVRAKRRSAPMHKTVPRKRATSDEGKHAFHRTTRHRRIGSAAVPGSGLLGGASEGESTLSLQQPSAEESGGVVVPTEDNQLQAGRMPAVDDSNAASRGSRAERAAAGAQHKRRSSGRPVSGATSSPMSYQHNAMALKASSQSSAGGMTLHLRSTADPSSPANPNGPQEPASPESNKLISVPKPYLHSEVVEQPIYNYQKETKKLIKELSGLHTDDEEDDDEVNQLLPFRAEPGKGAVPGLAGEAGLRAPPSPSSSGNNSAGGAVTLWRASSLTSGSLVPLLEDEAMDSHPSPVHMQQVGEGSADMAALEGWAPLALEEEEETSSSEYYDAEEALDAVESTAQSY